MKLRLVEIELHSYCNRRCVWCPNSFIDRRSEKKVMSEGLFIKILQGLSILNYKGYISLSRYNEPLSTPELLTERISQIREHLPECTIVCNTNGDYPWSGFDIDELTVMDYNHTKEDVIGEKVRITKLKIINNRGGALNIKTPPRTEPCYEPTYFIGINYDGTVSPCCNIRNDIEKHKPYIFGDLNKQSLSEILNSQKRKDFINQLFLKQFPDICKNCSKGAGRYTRDQPSIGGDMS